MIELIILILTPRSDTMIKEKKSWAYSYKIINVINVSVYMTKFKFIILLAYNQPFNEGPDGINLVSVIGQKI